MSAESEPRPLRRFSDSVAAIGRERAERLEQSLQALNRVVVAFSGGVDSAVVATAAVLVLGVDRVRLVMATGPAVPRTEIEEGLETAAVIGAELHQVDALEWQSPDYQRNDSRRCYHCKSHLYRTLSSFRQSLHEADEWKLVNGVNADDLSDYRPGLQAADEADVVAPLAECQLNKADVRALARAWQLPLHDKPASPCLASRIAYGEEVSVERLAKVEAAEAMLRELGLRELRVRYHAQEMARIEVPLSELERMVREEVRQKIVDRFQAIGFRYITIDLQGFRSGNLNSALEPALALTQDQALVQIKRASDRS